MGAKISIIIPIFNAEAYIEKALISALNQTYPDIEYILVDDVCTDQSMKIVTEIVSAHPRKESVRILHNSQNEGPGGSRNTGIKASLGDYLFFMDSDDEIPLWSLEKLMSAMQKSPSDYVIGSVEQVDPETGPVKFKRLEAERITPVTAIDFEKLLDSYFKMVVWNKLYRKSFLNSHSIWFRPGIYHEDQLFLFKMAFCTSSYVSIPDITYRYYQRNNSITGVYKSRNYKDLNSVIREMIDECRNLRTDPEKYEAASRYIFMLQFGVAIHLIDSPLIGKEEKKMFLKQLGRIPIARDNYLRIPKQSLKQKGLYPLFYYSPVLFQKIYFGLHEIRKMIQK